MYGHFSPLSPPVQAEIIRKLRKEDESLWTVNILARLFNAKRTVIR